MLFFMAIICGYGGVFDAAAYKDEAVKFAVTKAVTPAWHQIFLKAIGGECGFLPLATAMKRVDDRVNSKLARLPRRLRRNLIS